MNIIERIIAKKAKKEIVRAGDEISVNVDLAIAHDVTGPMAIEQFKKIGTDKLYDEKKVVFVLDHNVPSSTINSRVQQKVIREFCNTTGAILFGNGEGVIHQIVYEKGLYKKGDLIVGANSHTCTAGAFGAIAIPIGSTEFAAVMALGVIDIEVPEVYVIEINGKLNPGVYAKDVVLYLIGKFGTNGFTDKAVIISGSSIVNMNDDGKMTISNMLIEMGAMIGYIDNGDEIGDVKEKFIINSSEINSIVSCPSSPSNIKPVSEMEGIKINQAVIGSCTNGRLSDMRIAAEVLKGKRINENVNLIVIPASKIIAEKMDEEGLTKILRDAGAIICNPGCGPCFGAHQGLLAKDDCAISTTNRNFSGRMGHKDAKIYLASPHVVAESAINGYITKPEYTLLMEVQEACL